MCLFVRRKCGSVELVNPSWNATEELDLIAMYPGERFEDQGNDVPTGALVPKPAAAAQVTLAPQSALVLVTSHPTAASSFERKVAR